MKLHVDDDFEKCEVQIRVKFRDEEELQVLPPSLSPSFSIALLLAPWSLI